MTTYIIGDQEETTDYDNAHNMAFYKGLKSFIDKATGKVHKVGYKLIQNYNNFHSK